MAPASAARRASALRLPTASPCIGKDSRTSQSLSCDAPWSLWHFPRACCVGHPARPKDTKPQFRAGRRVEDPSNPCVSERPNPRAFATPTRRSTWRSRHRQTGCTEPMMFAVVRQSGLLKTEDSSRRFTKTSKASTSALRTRELDPCCPLQHCHRQVVFGTASRGTCRTNHVDVTTKHLAVLTCRNLQALLHLEQRVVRTVDTAGSQVVTLQNPVRLNTPFIASGFTDWTPLNTAHSRCSLLGNPGQTLPNKAL